MKGPGEMKEKQETPVQSSLTTATPTTAIGAALNNMQQQILWN